MRKSRGHVGSKSFSRSVASTRPMYAVMHSVSRKSVLYGKFVASVHWANVVARGWVDVSDLFGCSVNFPVADPCGSPGAPSC
jgi:hypothetical protein